jgi:hypothetical protein
MIGRAGRLLTVLAIGVSGWWLAAPLLTGPTGAGHPAAAADGKSTPKTCREANPAWSEIAVDLTAEGPSIEPGRVFRLSDGTIAVLLVITEANGDGQATAFDFSASVRVAAVIVVVGDDGAYLPFDPPTRNGSDLSAPDRTGIDGIAFCYRIQVPNPPPPGATPPPQTPTPRMASATSTPETFALGAVQTANALATEASAGRATAETGATVAAAEAATRAAESTAAEATIASLATAHAAQEATAAVQATAAAASATAAAAERAAIQATASAEVAAAQATAATLATADVARQTELAAAHVERTEAAATIAALQATAAAPSPTPTETLLYGVPATESFDAWTATLPPGWKVNEGQLAADGSEFQGYAQPQMTVDRDDYVVEAEIQITDEPGCDSNFGIVARGSESGFYAGGVEWDCDAGSSIRLWALDRLLGQETRQLDQQWHTYRLEVDGDQITYSIDGAVVLEATDASFPSGGQVALWSNGVKLNVRAFRILVKP